MKPAKKEVKIGNSFLRVNSKKVNFEKRLGL